MIGRVSRRRFLGLLGAGSVAAACRTDEQADSAPSTTATTSSTLPPIDHGTPVGANPFGLGVASGDPDATSVVLWTWVDRAEGAGALVEVALDPAFERIVQRSPVIADAEAGGTARVLATDLQPDTAYWYRFALDGHVTAPARTRTAPAVGTAPAAPLRIGHLSCQRYASGYWTALTDVAAQAPDLVVHCGDYVYEDDRDGVRPVDQQPPTDLDGYRALWRRYKAEPELQAAHAVAPWVMVWDDHEVENNYQGATPNNRPAGDAFLAQRAAAYRAWWEFTPTRLPAPDGPSLRMHRRIDWGTLARFVLLDTRQYRDDQPCAGDLGVDLGPRCPASDDVTMLGTEQELWVVGELAHDATWTAVVQQVVLHQWRFLGGNALWNLDAWDGYPAARDRLVADLAVAPSPIVLTGDVHSSWVAEVRADPDDARSAPVAVELVAPGVSSSVPSALSGVGALVEQLSPHITWSETRRRGWVLHTVDTERWASEYRLVESVAEPGGTVTVAARFEVGASERTVRRVD